MIDFSFVSTATVRRSLIAAVVAVGGIVIDSAGGTALAQTSSAPSLDAQQTNTMPEAPRDERQPRRMHLPSHVRQQEKSELSSERTFDQDLRICRGC